MQSSFISWLRGYVRIQVRGKQSVALINQLMEDGFSIWNVRMVGDDLLELSILIPDFFRLRPILKRTGCRMHVLMRSGFPFFLDKLGSRKAFLGGFLGFVIAIYLLSSLVWQVTVEGNQILSKADILQAAGKQGMYRFQWKFRLKEPEELSRQLQAQLPGTAWVGVEIQGTHLRIKVVEATIPDKKPLMNPRHLIASKNALVTEIYAEKGRPMVKPNTYVRKGDVLISGIIGDEENQHIVVANGTVKGLVWYTSKIEVPLTQKYKVYSGESKNRNYLVLGSRALQITGYGEPEFAQFETIPERKTLQWRTFILPIGWLHEKVMEVQFVEQPVEWAEAKTMGIKQAEAELLSSAGKDSRIVSQKILHEKSENGKVYMEVHFEVEEWIMEEQPIVKQGE